MPKLYAIVRMGDFRPVPPMDENPGFDEQGCVVFQNGHAAAAFAARQNRMYECDALAVPLDEVNWTPLVTEEPNPCSPPSA